MPHAESASAVPRRRWMLFAPFLVVVVLAAGWSALWFYAAGRAEADLAAWRESERQAGRTQHCASQSIGGYPFRIEVRCDGAGLQLDGAPTLQLKLPTAVVAAQVYDPKLLIGEFTGPLEISEAGRPPAVIVNWNLGQASVRGLPSRVERASLVLAGPTVRAPSLAGDDAVLSARRLELHGRQAPGSAANDPVIETVLRLDTAVADKLESVFDLAIADRLRLLAANPIDADVAATLRGVDDISLRLTPRGGLDGELRLTVVGIEKLLKMLDIDRIMTEGQVGATFNALDRLMPGLGGIARQSAAPGLVAALGERTTLEGKPAVAFPVRFVDGTVFIGPFQVGVVPPLF